MSFLESRLSPLLVLLVLLLYDLTSGAIGSLFGDWFKKEWLAGVGLAILIVLILVFDPQQRVQTWLRRAAGASPTPTVSDQPPDPFCGLIAFASHGDGIFSTRDAIRYHWCGLQNERPKPTLQHAWILTTGDASHANAERMKAELKELGVPPGIVELVPIGEAPARDLQAAFEGVETIYAGSDARALGEDQIICDYTGGTGTMSGGMILAAAAPRRWLQFMEPNALLPDGRADLAAGSEPRLVDIRFRLKRSRR